MLVKFRTSLALCTFLGLPGMASAEAPPPETVKDEDVFSDLTPYQRDRIQVMQGNTIWSIARVNRPQSATIEQMVLGLYFSNPEAFAEHNISRLKAGSQLIVPPAILFAQISPADAKELLRKLRSGASYDAGRILHFKQSGQTSPRHPSKNEARIPATNREGSAAASTDDSKSTPVIEIHTMQPSTPQEAAPQIQPDKAASPPAPSLTHETAVIQIEQRTTEPTTVPAPQSAENISAAPPSVSTVATPAQATPEVKETTPPCTTEDCRLALSRDAESRLIAIQNEIQQLNAKLTPQQQSQAALSTAHEAANEKTPGNDEAAPVTGFNHLLKIWKSIKALDPVTLASIAAVGVLLEMAVRALIKLALTLRKRAVTTATSPDTAPKSGQNSASPEQRAVAAAPETKPLPVGPSPGRFETVVLSSDDELSPYADIPELGYANAASIGEKNREYSPYHDDKSAIKANQKPAFYDAAENIDPPPLRTSVVAERPDQKKPVSAVDHNNYVDDDLGLDFGLQDGKQNSKH
ncbi:FimV/HubP family polar landmark protein [Candidatus Methylospira mobilis]|nr:FimV/HubP family polar landmark protein [Candidatus Methylospira mobilis]WNV04879.1 FimV/HubP family polar landmark protein [Candidatus Methylospira mobilis]